ncbi:MAG: ATP-binding protein [Saccharospirillaceae bacterium]|nr:ATP-binding protein [Saccharospirillaceae bacterium]
MKQIVSYMASLRLFTKFYLFMASSTILLVTIVVLLSDYVESKLSLIEPEHRQTLRLYASQASNLYLRYPDIDQRQQELNSWLKQLMTKENTWAAMGKTQAEWLAGELDTRLFGENPDLSVGRSIDYPIHLYYSFNPVMKLRMEGTDYFLFIQLPQRMRPGTYSQEIDHAITYGLPVLLVALFAALMFRHINAPLTLLQHVTNRFRSGDYQARTIGDMKGRQDEFGELGQSFDAMADHISVLMQRQQQLIQDISHELRTPITRIKLALSDNQDDPALQRVAREVDGMQSLLEDTLTLSWLDNAELNNKEGFALETLDICLLIDAIAEDARFEFPDHYLVLRLPDECILEYSNHRALGQAIENIVRNAMKYSPLGSEVTVSLEESGNDVMIEISDQGPGVKEEYLDAIFEPFFRLDKARTKDEKSSGYGLGLALSRRQIQALRGSVIARLNHTDDSGSQTVAGLAFEIRLPRK